jgi:hypothetical protein
LNKHTVLQLYPPPQHEVALEGLYLARVGDPRQPPHVLVYTSFIASLDGRFAAKYGRTGFRRNFVFDAEWCGKRYANKQGGIRRRGGRRVADYHGDRQILLRGKP